MKLKTEQNEEEKGEDYMDYLYTIINFSNKNIEETK